MVPGQLSAQLPRKPRTFQNEYSLGPSGRGVITGGSVVYMISADKAIVVDVTPGNAAGTLSRIEK